jgi:uncharacterized glyoxalase superfamily protein PhnB
MGRGFLACQITFPDLEIFHYPLTIEVPMFTAAVFYERPMAALAWLEKAFGFETTMLIEGPDGDERMMHSEMSFMGQGCIMVGGEWADWARSPLSVQGGNTQSLRVDVPKDVDAHCERARAAGAIITAEPETQFYGARTYRCVDPEGHHWTFSEKVADMTVDEMEKAGGVKIKGSL